MTYDWKKLGELPIREGDTVQFAADGKIFKIKWVNPGEIVDGSPNDEGQFYAFSISGNEMQPATKSVCSQWRIVQKMSNNTPFDELPAEDKKILFLAHYNDEPIDVYRDGEFVGKLAAGRPFLPRLVYVLSPKIHFMSGVTYKEKTSKKDWHCIGVLDEYVYFTPAPGEPALQMTIDDAQGMFDEN